MIADQGLPVLFNYAKQPPEYVALADALTRAAIDVIVLQRPMMYFMPDLIRDIQARGIPVIIELDDDFHTAHPDNQAFSQNHPRLNPQMNWHHLGACVRLADHVIVATPALARRYGSHGRVSVIRNYVSDEWLGFEHVYGTKTIGWPGTIIHHPIDPQATDGAIPHVLGAHPDWSFTVIGGAKHEDEIRKGFELADWCDVSMTEWRSLELHPYLVNTIDVGIVPLADMAFNEAKSYLKGLEFAALGIPFVASDTPEYEHLRSEFGIGCTVRNRSRDWRRKLSGWMTNEWMREDEGKRWRQIVKDELTIQGNAWRWAECWSDVAVKGVHRASVGR